MTSGLCSVERTLPPMSMYELDTGTLKLMFVNVVAYRGMHLRRTTVLMFAHESHHLPNTPVPQHCRSMAQVPIVIWLWVVWQRLQRSGRSRASKWSCNGCYDRRIQPVSYTHLTLPTTPYV